MKLLAHILTIPGLLLFSFNEKSSGSEAAKTHETVTSGEIQSNSINAADFAGKPDELLENSSELKVFYNGLTFALVVDISDNKSLNRNKSIELAYLIIGEKLK
jgi:hypothetical protein